MKKIPTYYKSVDNKFNLIYGNCYDILQSFNFKFDLIFADPPYFLSNGGISFNSGKVVCVNKGDWDISRDATYIDEFNKKWLSCCSKKLKENGTIWVSGTYHNIFSVAKVLSELNFKILNVLTWAKTDPPENISHRTLTHATEFIIWAKKKGKLHHTYNYDLMYKLNNGKQMTDIWYLPAVHKWEKSCGKHPTQKPLSLLARIILASTKKDEWILDPFNGSGTTGIAANLLDRNYLGIDNNIKYLQLSAKRRNELNYSDIKKIYCSKLLAECHSNLVTDKSKKVLIKKINSKKQWEDIIHSHELCLPFTKDYYMYNILDVDYILTMYNQEYILLKVGHMRPKIRTKENTDHPLITSHLSKTYIVYWYFYLYEDKSIIVKKEDANLKALINSQKEDKTFYLKDLKDYIRISNF